MVPSGCRLPSPVPSYFAAHSRCGASECVAATAPYASVPLRSPRGPARRGGLCKARGQVQGEEIRVLPQDLRQALTLLRPCNATDRRAG
jgi:hypothetical protein